MVRAYPGSAGDLVQAADETIDLLPSGPVSYTDGGTPFTTFPDGSELVSLFGPDDSTLSGLSPQSMQAEGFNENLAAKLSRSQRGALADKLVEYWRVDLESRQSWQDLTEQALVLLGVKKLDASRLPFPGAAALQHPVIAEAVTQFNSNAIQEFFPATGPVKGDLAGQATDETEAQVRRGEQFMNYYLVHVDKGYYADSDQMLFYLPLAGSVFRKCCSDPRDQMPRARYVKAEDFVAPYFARDLENCPRYCHQYQMTGVEIRHAQHAGEFIDIDLPQPPTEQDEGAGRHVEDVSDRRTRVLHQDDELYDFLEYHLMMNLPAGVDKADPGHLELPYIVIVDRSTREVLSVRRNWKETDHAFKKRIWFAHYKFLPGLGFYGWGFLHVMGSLAEAISGSARALLDSALMATVQGGFRAKDGAKGGGSISIEPGKWKDIDATQDELSKTFFTPPFREPAPALVNLMTAMVADARRFASLTEVLVGQADNKAPVGTTIALIEQSMKLFTAIHKRIFNAASHEFAMLGELLHDFGPYEEYPYFLEGNQRYAFREDFDDRVDFLPVADPNIVSDVQRISLAQAQLEVVLKDPLFGPEERIEAYRRFFTALKVPQIEKVLPKAPKPTYLDPMGENQLMMTSKPVRAFPGQRHDLHNLVHQNALQIAENTLPPDQFQTIYAVFMSHIREHLALQMAEQASAAMMQQIGAPLPPTDIYGDNQDQPPELERAISMAVVNSLPPIPPPQPNSAAAMNAQAAPQDNQAEQQAAIDAKNAEAQAKIERDTAQFVTQHKRSELEHAQAMRHREDEHRQQMRQADAQAQSQILREHAKARSQLMGDRVTGATKTALEVQREHAKVKARKQAERAAKKKSGATKH